MDLHAGTDVAGHSIQATLSCKELHGMSICQQLHISFERLAPTSPMGIIAPHTDTLDRFIATLLAQPFKVVWGRSGPAHSSRSVVVSESRVTQERICQRTV